jgi:hypothetical protein
MTRRLPSPAAPPQLDLDIGELHLPGWGRHEQETLVDAFHQELKRLALENGLLERLAAKGTFLDIEHLRFDAAAGAGPEEAGAGAAAAVMRSLGVEPR